TPHRHYRRRGRQRRHPHGCDTSDSGERIVDTVDSLSTKKIGVRRWAVRLFRAALLVAVVLALRLPGSGSTLFHDDIALEDALVLYPSAFALDPGSNLTTVRGEDGGDLGYIVKTLPKSESI